jgi:PPOX class probable F420-dependent enzyme
LSEIPIVKSCPLWRPSGRVEELLDGVPDELDPVVQFASLSTVNPDGGPQSSVVWFLFDGEAVLFSVLATRQKARPVIRDPRVSVAIYDLANPYSSVELRGTAEVLPDPGRELSRQLSQKYLGEDPPPESGSRLILRVTPAKVTSFSP